MEAQEENIKAPESDFKWQDQYCLPPNAMVVETHCKLESVLGTVYFPASCAFLRSSQGARLLMTSSKSPSSHVQASQNHVSPLTPDCTARPGQW